MDERVDPDDRSVAAYLRAVRRAPGSGLRLAAAVTFGLALALERGLRVLGLAVLAVLVVAALVFYPYFRKHGAAKWGDPKLPM